MADVTFIEGTGDIKREAFKMFGEVPEEETNKWELLGRKIEDMSLEMNPNVETLTDITGETQTTLDKYEKQTSVAPYYARKESKFGAWLYNVVREERTLSDVERNFLCVNVFAGADGSFDAWTQKGVVAVQSYGGNTKGLQIPFNIHWIGKKTYGTVSIEDGVPTFTPTPAA